MDTIVEFGEKIRRSMDAIAGVCPFCEEWFIVNYARRNGRVLDEFVRLSDIRDRITEYFQYGVVRDDFDNPEPSSGYHLTAVNQPETAPEVVTTRFRGAYPRALSQVSRVEFSTQYGQIADPRIVAYPVIRDVLRSFVQIWRPDYAVASCSDLFGYRTKGRPIYLDVTWMTYLSQPLAARITSPTGIRVERFADGGLLMIAAEATFDVNDPAHLAGAHAIRDAVACLNPPPQQPWRPAGSEGSR